MKQTSAFFLLLVMMMTAGCGKISYKKTPGGMPYKIFRSGDTQRVESGDIIKISFIRKIKDSLVYNTTNGLPAYIPITNYKEPYDISEIWTDLRVGDSIITVQMVDTFIKRSPNGVPPNLKKGDRIETTVKVLQIFKSDSAAKADEQKETEAFLKKEINFLEKYLTEKGVKAQKTPSGAWVEIINPGTGNLLDSGKYVSVDYTGTSFSGKKFDSNTDPAFNHTQPLSFVLGAGQMIKGFDEGVMFLRVGGIAKVYIPSLLAYGPSPDPRTGIKPFEHLIFDIKVTDVKDKAPTRAELEELQKQQQQKIDTTQSKK
ncbi:MAG TPA: FKBP-type peptidyl-prolyl cis-trans isomerase [Chitinophagaceae bacterium]|nr:FKBP-type peptidyl-prolyl cis-trans isomerase [Chitinophagaceae bacterium]